jgi:hypothetical protein
MTNVLCDDDTCANNLNGMCFLYSINVNLKYGEMENRKRKAYPSCQNYKERKDARTD